MMNDTEKMICEDAVSEGTIIRHEVFTVADSGQKSEQWIVEWYGEMYEVTKIDGEWAYFNRLINYSIEEGVRK